MRARGVGHDDMFYDLIDDSMAEALLDGTSTHSRFSALAAALGEIRAAGDRDAPVPSAELASLLDGSMGSGLVARRGRRALRVAGGVGLAAKLALGAGAAAAAVSGAGAAGVLPGPIVQLIEQVEETITPAGTDGSPDAPAVEAGNDPANPSPSGAPPASESTDPGAGATTDGGPEATTTDAPANPNAGQPSANADDKGANADDKGANAGQPSPNAVDKGDNASATGQTNGHSVEDPGGQPDANANGQTNGQGNGQGNGRGPGSG
jgi:hypothetical protein